MTEFFHRVGPKTSAVRQVWLLAALAVGVTVLILALMHRASNHVRATSEALSETQEAMHKMAVSLDLRLSDAQQEQTGWLAGQPTQADDASVKLEESLAERFAFIRNTAHLSSVSNNILALEDSARSLKELTTVCREWFISHTNTQAQLLRAKAEVAKHLGELGAAAAESESKLKSESHTRFDQFQKLPPGPEANKLARSILNSQSKSVIYTELHEKLIDLTLQVERIVTLESIEALTADRETRFPAAFSGLETTLDKLQEIAPDSAQRFAGTRKQLQALLAIPSEGENAATNSVSLLSLCERRLELVAKRLELQEQSSARVDEIRATGVDLQIGFNELQRDASVAANASMQATAGRMQWVGLLVTVAFLLLAFRIAGTLRNQLTTIQRNSAELDRAAAEARQAADSVRSSEERTRLIVDTALDAVIAMDGRGVITGWNKQAEVTFGWKSAEVSGRQVSQVIIPPAARGTETDGFLRVLQTGGTSADKQRIEVQALRRDGSEIPVELAVTPIRYQGTTSFSAFLRDISDRKKAEEQILASKEEAESANKMLQASLETAERLTVEAQAASKAKSEFLATMSHEIRTPMNGILGFAGLLLDTKLEPEQRDFLGTIKGSADALLAIINDILDFSKVEAGKLELESNWFDLAPVTVDVTRLLSAQATAKKLTLTVQSGSSPTPRVMADAARVRQVLLNLAGNAIKFTHQGGVTLQLEPQPETPDGKRFIRIGVRDTGIGIPKEKQAQMFQKFVQADSSHSRRYGGTGLGLAICKSLVELMGGQIGFDSAAGEGSTFWFTLPCETVSQSTPVPTTPSVVATRQNQPAPATSALILPPDFTVLLVEDNRTNQLLATTLLKKMKCQVDLAENGRIAVEKVRERSYALVLMDCHMPEMNGFEATAAIREWEASNRATRRLPIIALTASLMEQDKRQCQDAGMDDFLGKPIQTPELIAAIQRWGLPDTDKIKAP